MKINFGFVVATSNALQISLAILVGIPVGISVVAASLISPSANIAFAQDLKASKGDFVKSSVARLQQIGQVDSFIDSAQLPLNVRTSVKTWVHNKGTSQVPKVNADGSTVVFNLGKKRAKVTFVDSEKSTVMINGHAFTFDTDSSLSHNLDTILELLDTKHTIAPLTGGGMAQLPPLDIGAVAITGILIFSFDHKAETK